MADMHPSRWKVLEAVPQAESQYEWSFNSKWNTNKEIAGRLDKSIGSVSKKTIQLWREGYIERRKRDSKSRKKPYEYRRTEKGENTVKSE